MLIYLIGRLFDLRPSPLNSLGVALLFALSEPSIITKISFQLSFGATLGLILFFRPFEEKLTALFPKRPLDLLQKMSLLDQVGYLLCSYLRKGIALQGSVLIFTLPLILFHFKTFPLISLLYNLIFPLLFALLMALFLLQLDFLTAPLASFLITIIEGVPRRLLFKVTAWQLLIFLGSLSLIYFARKLKVKNWINKGEKSLLWKRNGVR